MYRRPSAFQKNVVALSLVQTYPILRSSNENVPQALWFHQHARGQHRHSGRLHYHLEYLVRKSSDRKIVRNKQAIEDKLAAQPCDPLDNDEPEENMEEWVSFFDYLSLGEKKLQVGWIFYEIFLDFRI